jgi:hypothetical protein
MLLISSVLGSGAIALLLVYAWFKHSHRKLEDELDSRVRTKVCEIQSRDAELTQDLQKSIVESKKSIPEVISEWQGSRRNLLAIAGLGQRDYAWDDRHLDQWRKEERARLGRKDLGRLRVRWITSMAVVLLSTCLIAGGVYTSNDRRLASTPETSTLNSGWVVVDPHTSN